MHTREESETQLRVAELRLAAGKVFNEEPHWRFLLYFPQSSNWPLYLHITECPLCVSL